MLSRSMVLFYQLDVKDNETTDVCLKNLLTSLVLKNPVYTEVINLIDIAKKNEIK